MAPWPPCSCAYDRYHGAMLLDEGAGIMAGSLVVATESRESGLVGYFRALTGLTWIPPNMWKAAPIVI